MAAGAASAQLHHVVLLLRSSFLRTPNAGMKCHHGADKFIERYFYDCVYKCAVRLQSALPPAQPAAEPMLPLCAAPETTWGSPWVLQPSCYGFWLRCVRHAVSQEVPTLQLRLPLTGCSCLQLPQFITNYKNKSAEALSPWFLAQWLLVGGAAAAGPPCSSLWTHPACYTHSGLSPAQVVCSKPLAQSLRGHAMLRLYLELLAAHRACLL